MGSGSPRTCDWRQGHVAPIGSVAPGRGRHSLVSIAGWRLWRRRHPEASDQPALNRRAEQYLGRVFVLEEPIENGFGKVRVGDSLWRVKGGDAAAGTRARVTGTDGFVLVVEPED